MLNAICEIIGFFKCLIRYKISLPLSSTHRGLLPLEKHFFFVVEASPCDLFWNAVLVFYLQYCFIYNIQRMKMFLLFFLRWNRSPFSLDKSGMLSVSESESGLSSLVSCSLGTSSESSFAVDRCRSRGPVLNKLRMQMKQNKISLWTQELNCQNNC